MTKIERAEMLMRQRGNGWWSQLCEMVPELLPLSGTPQPPEYHAEGDVAIHTRLAIEACPEDCDPDLLWVALLHDIGKPATTQQNEEGRITAYGHAPLAAAMAGDILSRFDLPEIRRQRIQWLIRHHTFHHSWQLENAERNATGTAVVLQPNGVVHNPQLMRGDSVSFDVDWSQNKLCYSVSSVDGKFIFPQINQTNFNFTTVISINGTGCVYNCYPMLYSQTTPRSDL